MVDQKQWGRISQLVGEYGQRLVELEFIRRDVECFRPLKDQKGCDLLIRIKNNYLRIQVKTVSIGQESHFLVLFKDNFSSTFDFDFLIVCSVIKSYCAYYIIPKSEIIGKTSITYPYSEKGKFSIFKNKWDLLTDNEVII